MMLNRWNAHCFTCCYEMTRSWLFWTVDLQTVAPPKGRKKKKKIRKKKRFTFSSNCIFTHSGPNYMQ